MIEHRSILCCYEGCDELIWFSPEKEKRARRTHEWWHCPNGHRQHFSGQTAEEKRIEALEATVQSLRRELLWATDSRDLARRFCPWTDCFHYAANAFGLRIHLIRKHGMPTIAQVRGDSLEMAS